jgi:hypothetical protein
MAALWASASNLVARFLAPTCKFSGVERRQPKLTLQHVLMILSMLCILAGQISLENRYSRLVKFDFDLTEYRIRPIETKVLGAVNLAILFAAIVFRKRGIRVLWAGIAAAFVATAATAVILVLRHSK